MNKLNNAVLVVDDEPKIRRFLRAAYELQGFLVREAESAAEGLKSTTFAPPDLIILDLRLPDLSGSAVLERIRSWSNVPIIMLSIESNEAEKVRLLKLGADDYIVKPFGIAELLARSDAALRRYFRAVPKDPVVKAGRLKVDLASRVVTLNDERLQLSRQEYKLLYVLSSHLGLVVTHQQLIKEIWSTRHEENVQYLRILVRKLRQKIEDDPSNPRMLVTESGVGYRLEPGSNEYTSAPPSSSPRTSPSANGPACSTTPRWRPRCSTA